MCGLQVGGSHSTAGSSGTERHGTVEGLLSLTPAGCEGSRDARDAHLLWCAEPGEEHGRVFTVTYYWQMQAGRPHGALCAGQP